MPILTTENVSFSYDKKTNAINNVNLSIESGEYVAIIGHNGSGKSTLARLFNALINPTSGEITVDGMSTRDKKNLAKIRETVGVVFQNPDNQLVASIVVDDVAFGPENLGLSREEIGSRIDFALSAVGMENFRNASPERLSGGQKQRVAIAGVLALKPKILVLDEATSMLDPEGRKDVLDVVKKLNKENGVTVIAITHYMEEVVGADRVIVVNDGAVAFTGTPEEVFAQKEMLNNFGLELPISAYIAQKLREKGLELPQNILTEDGLAEALCALKQKN